MSRAGEELDAERGLRPEDPTPSPLPPAPASAGPVTIDTGVPPVLTSPKTATFAETLPSQSSSTWSRRLSRRLSRTASRMARRVVELRLHLGLFLVTPLFVATVLCTVAGYAPEWTLTMALKFSCISGSFATFYDFLSQASQLIFIRKKLRKEAAAMHFGVPPDIPSYCVHLWRDYDWYRTLRYAGVHFIYNGPYHMPKLLLLNYLFPGKPDFSIAIHKLILAELVFSPGESLGVLIGVQTMRDGNCGNVCQKLRNEFWKFQMTKWVGHTIPHFFSFLLTNDVVKLYLYTFGLKACFEIVLAILAARPVKNKSGVGLTTADLEEQAPLVGKQAPPKRWYS